jgi:hypothetical protein
VQVWAPPYRVENEKKTVEINHTRRCTRRIVSGAYAISLR